MGGYSYLILGTGVGTAIADKLARYEDTYEIVFADLSEHRVRQAIQRFKERNHLITCYPLTFDIAHERPEILAKLFGQFDVVISAIPAKFDPIVTQACIEAGVHSCNLGAVLEKTKEQLLLDDAARHAGSRVVTDTGVDPGLVNVWAQALCHRRPGKVPASMAIYAGGVPQHPREPSNYGRMYAAEGTWHMVFDRVTNIREGALEHVNAVDTFRCVPTPPALARRGLAAFPKMEMFASSGAALAPWDLQRSGVKSFTGWTLRWPGFKQFVLGHTDETSFKEAFSRLPPTDTDHPDIMYARADAIWEDGAFASYELVSRYDQAKGFSAMQKATGIPAAITARMLAQERLPTGVDTFDRALHRRGSMRTYLDEVGVDLQFTYEEDGISGS